MGWKKALGDRFVTHEPDPVFIRGMKIPVIGHDHPRRQSSNTAIASIALASEPRQWQWLCNTEMVGLTIVLMLTFGDVPGAVFPAPVRLRPCGAVPAPAFRAR
jgi:hypothetical protein